MFVEENEGNAIKRNKENEKALTSEGSKGRQGLDKHRNKYGSMEFRMGGPRKCTQLFAGRMIYAFSESHWKQKKRTF